jgi:hypothetical protein
MTVIFTSNERDDVLSSSTEFGKALIGIIQTFAEVTHSDPG